MIAYLDDAVHLSSDPPDAPPLRTSYLVHTGEAGCPSIQIAPGMLASALGLCGPTHLAPVFNCSSCTIWRCALEYGLAEPGPPVYVEYEHEDRSTHCFYGPSTKIRQISRTIIWMPSCRRSLRSSPTMAVT